MRTNVPPDHQLRTVIAPGLIMVEGGGTPIGQPGDAVGSKGDPRRGMGPTPGAGGMIGALQGPPLCDQRGSICSTLLQVIR
jgi:hypothetical protein